MLVSQSEGGTTLHSLARGLVSPGIKMAKSPQKEQVRGASLFQFVLLANSDIVWRTCHLQCVGC